MGYGGHGDLSPGDPDASASAVGGSQIGGGSGGNVGGGGWDVSPPTGRMDAYGETRGSGGSSGIGGSGKSGFYGGWEAATMLGDDGQDPAMSGFAEPGAFGFDPSMGAKVGALAGLVGGLPVGLIGALMGGLMGVAQSGGDVGAGGYGPGDPDAGGGPVSEWASDNEGIPDDPEEFFMSGLFGGGSNPVIPEAPERPVGGSSMGVSADPMSLRVFDDEDEDEDDLLKSLVFNESEFNKSLF